MTDAYRRLPWVVRWRAALIHEAIVRAVARVVPIRVRYWVVINAWANATTGEYGSVDATQATVADILDRMEKRTR